MLGPDRCTGATFLDVGSGSGLFSLAAMRLGARRVHSFDADADSVKCTLALRDRYFPNAANWTVEQASALDAEYLQRLGQWDIVYSWGVLHHTGNMWRALDLVADLVAESGVFFVALYNDQDHWSRWWSHVKRAYNRGRMSRFIVASVFMPYWATRGLMVDLVRRRKPWVRYRAYQQSRGMSVVHDWKDWLGGYPFEVAKPGDLVDFGRRKMLSLTKLKTCGGIGCNEFVFERR